MFLIIYKNSFIQTSYNARRGVNIKKFFIWLIWKISREQSNREQWDLSNSNTKNSKTKKYNVIKSLTRHLRNSGLHEKREEGEGG